MTVTNMTSVMTNNSSVNTINGTTVTTDWPLTFTIPVVTLMVTSCIINVIGNSLFLVVVARHPDMRNRSSLFLVNLAVADILVGLLVAPFSVITLIRGHWLPEDNGFLCGCNTFLNAMCIFTTIHTLMYISIQRYFPIVRPLQKPLSVRTVAVMMLAAWSWACLLAAIIVTQFGFEHRIGNAQCGPKEATEVSLVIGATGIVIPFL